MTNLEEQFLNVLEDKRYALVHNNVRDNRIKIYAKWITYEEAMKKLNCNTLRGAYCALFIWKNGLWHYASWLNGKIMVDMPLYVANRLAPILQGLKLLNNDES